MTTVDIAAPALVPARTTHRGIPLSRIISTELRKMFDTRSGFWLLASIAILSVTGEWSQRSGLTTFTAAG